MADDKCKTTLHNAEHINAEHINVQEDSEIKYWLPGGRDSSGGLL